MVVRVVVMLVSVVVVMFLLMLMPDVVLPGRVLPFHANVNCTHRRLDNALGHDCHTVQAKLCRLLVQFINRYKPGIDKCCSEHIARYTGNTFKK